MGRIINRPSGRRGAHSTRKPAILALEPRIMFDGAAVADAAHAAADAAIQAVAAPVVVREADPSKDNGKKEVAFVDTSVADYKTLEAGIKDGVEIVEIDSTASGLAQMAQWAQTHSGYDAIHVLSHGSGGTLVLGTDIITDGGLSKATVDAELAVVGKSLTADGDILLYGCDVAAGPSGDAFLADFSRLTGADVAASKDVTGSSLLGGNWTLEKQVGTIDVAGLEIGTYQSLLTLAGTTVDVYMDENFNGTWALLQTWTISNTTAEYDDNGGVVLDISDTSFVYRITNSENLQLLPLKLVFNAPDISQLKNTSVSVSSFVLRNGQSGAFENYTPPAGAVTLTYDVANPNILYYSGLNEVYTYRGDSNANWHWYDGSITLNYTVASVNDPTGPTTTVSAAALSADTGSSNTDWVTNTASQTISGTLSANLGAGEKVQVSYDNGGTWTDATTYAQGSSNWSTTATLSGTGTFQVRVSDGTNGGTAFTHTYTLDNTAPVISAASVPAAAMKVGDTVTVSLTVSDDGGSAYTLGSSSIDGFALGNLTRVDATHYTAQFTVTEGGTDVAAGSDIPLSIVLTDAAGNSNAAYTTAIAQAGDSIDAHKPVVTAVTVPAAAMKVGDVVTATITVASDSDTLALTSGTIGGFALSNLQKVDDTTYTAQFTVANGGTDVAAGSNIPVSLTLHDSAGNASTAFTTAIAQAGDAIDANRPVVAGVSVPVGAMKIGDTVTATITVNNDGGDSYTLGTSSIGGFALSNLQRVNATTYTAQFTVTEGGTDVAAASNIPLSIVLNDSAGNANTAYTTAITQGGDSIDANRPVVSNVTLNAASYKVGDTITATITVASDTDTGYTINTATIGGHTFGNLTRVNATTWTATYAVQSGDTDVFAGNPAVNVVLADAAGNQSTAYTTAIAQATTIGGHAPTDIGLSAATSALAAGSTIGSLSATDTNSGSETFTYSLPNGADDNSSFAIAGSTLKVGGGGITAGSYIVTVRVTDAGGNTFDKQFTITAVNTPAVTSINRAGAQATKGTGGLDYTVTFNQTVEGVDAGDFSVVKGAGVTGTAVITVTAGNSGDSTYTVHVAGLDGDGTVELDLNGTGTGIVAASDHSTAILTGSSGGQTYTLDNTAPAAPSGLTISDDTGSSSTDGITNDATLTIGGTAEADSSVEVFKDGVSIGTTTADGTGAWSFNYTGTTLAEGTYAFTAKATDTAGNTGTASTAKSVTIDTTAPGAPSTPDMAAGSDTGVDSTDDITTNTTPTVTGTAAANATVKLYDTDGNTLLGTTTADDSGVWSITSSALGLGNHTLTVKATDAAGNTGTASSGLDIQIVAAPAAPTGLTISNDTGSSNSDGKTNVATQTISGSAPANATVLVYKDGVSIGTVTADGAGAWSFDYTGTTLAQGTYAFTAVSRVSGQDSAASTALNVTVDTTAPAAPSVTGIGSDDGSSSTDGITTDTTLTITGTAEANSTVEVFKDGVSIGTTTANGSGAWSFDHAGTTLTLGNYVFTAKAKDAAGNESSASAGLTAKVTTDSTAPAAPAMTVSGGGTSTAVSATGTAEANATVKIYDGATLLGTVTADGTGAWTFSGTLAVGSHTLTATATDATGNVSAVSGATTLTIETPPVSAAPLTNTNTNTNAPPTIAPVVTGDTGSAGLVTVVRTVSQTPSDTAGSGFSLNSGIVSTSSGGLGGGISSTLGDTRSTGGGGTFQVALAGRAPGGGDALVVNTRVPDASFDPGTRISVTVPGDAFAHTRADATVTLTATRGDGAALPGWMSFNPRTGTFEGTPPPNFRGEVVVKVTARDNDGRQVVQTFKIVVGQGQGNIAPRGDGGRPQGEGQGQPQGAPGRTGDAGHDRVPGTSVAGRSSLTQQLRELSQEGRIAKQAALLTALKRGGKAA